MITVTGTASSGKRVAAYAALAANDPVLAGMIETHGTPDPFLCNDGGRTGTSNFAAMMLHIIGQQISITVALILYDRIRKYARLFSVQGGGRDWVLIWIF